MRPKITNLHAAPHSGTIEQKFREKTADRIYLYSELELFRSPMACAAAIPANLSLTQTWHNLYRYLACWPVIFAKQQAPSS